MIDRIRSNKVVWLVILILLMLRAFGLKSLLLPFMDYLFIFLVVLFSTFDLKHLYSKIIIIYLFFFIISCLYSYFFNGQKLLPLIVHSFNYYALLFLFVLFKYKPSFREIERVFIVVSVLFCSCYILQWLIYPTVWFIGAEYNVNEEMFRMRLSGSITCYALFLYGINKFLKSQKISLLLYSLLGGIPILIQGFRTLVVLSVITTFLIIPFVVKSSFKTVMYSVCGAIMAFLIMNTSLVDHKINEMMERQTNNQTFANKDYVRYIGFDYYWNNFFTKPYEKVIGGGLPGDHSSKYAQTFATLSESHLWIQDLGLVGLSMMIGIPAVICLIVIYIICIIRCKEPSLQYIRFTLVIVLIGSIFTTMELYRPGNLLLLSLFLYMEYRYHLERRQQFYVLK